MGRKRILGKTTDFLTGREITDTDDERLRQRIARFLVQEKGYAKEDIQSRRGLRFGIGDKQVVSMIDFVVTLKGEPYMIIKYGPGSIITRERPALACARILGNFQVPVTVVTNGIDAEVLDTVSADVIGTGLEAIPDKATAEEKLKNMNFQALPPERLEAEKRIVSAYDYLEHSLECDDDWCET